MNIARECQPNGAGSTVTDAEFVLIDVVVTEPTGHCSASYRMRRLIYLSTSQIGDDPGEIDRIVECSRIRNEQAGITGMLWFNGTNFAQVLEGCHDVVDETLHRIRIDVRHTDFRLIADRDVTTRMFSNWAMRRADDNADCIEKTAFLVGYARRECPKMAREILEIISTS